MPNAQERQEVHSPTPRRLRNSHTQASSRSGLASYVASYPSQRHMRFVIPARLLRPRYLFYAEQGRRTNENKKMVITHEGVPSAARYIQVYKSSMQIIGVIIGGQTRAPI